MITKNIKGLWFYGLSGSGKTLASKFLVSVGGTDPRYAKTKKLITKPVKKTLLKNSKVFVVPPGIEPGTQGFSVLCSTN